jgi:hypothetical protein
MWDLIAGLVRPVHRPETPLLHGVMAWKTQSQRLSPRTPAAYRMPIYPVIAERPDSMGSYPQQILDRKESDGSNFDRVEN